jgi:ADP-ribosylglycohydrolase/sugar/nucleoside kinase (ribokinase family)
VTTLVVGNAALHDLIATADTATPGSSIGKLWAGPGSRGRWLPGGAGPTVALAMAARGSTVALWHPLPKVDLEGPFLRLALAGVDVSRCPRIDEATCCVLIRSGDEVTAWSSLNVAPEVISPAAPEGIDHLVLCPVWGPWSESFLSSIAATGVKRSLIGVLPESALRYQWDTVVVSERQANSRMLARLQATTVAVTRGAQGSSVRDRGDWMEVPAAPATVVDATGAGDVYGGTFLWAMTTGRSPGQAAAEAARAAASCCEHWGAQTSLAMPQHGSSVDVLSRARGALFGLACGDAFGMPGAFLSPALRRQLLGTVTRLVAAPVESPYHSGYRAGQVTDDTQQAQALTRAIVADGALNPEEVARELNDWLESAGGADGLAVGPSTRRGLLAWRAGVDLWQAGRHGTSNGGAMRIAPVGVVHGLRAPVDPDRLRDDVVAACLPTHNTTVAIGAAHAVAAAIAAGVAGESWASVLDAGGAAAAKSTKGFWVYAPDVRARIDLACRLAVGATSDADCLDLMSGLIGTGEPSAEAVPAAFGVAARAQGDPAMAIALAGNLDGDSDTIAAMAGAICGAWAGEDRIPAAWRQTVAAVNGLDIDAWVGQLAAVARGAVAQEAQ